MTLAVDAIQIGLLILAIGIGVGGLTWWLKRRRRDVWQDLARARGLTFSDLSEGPLVSGRLNDHAVEISIDDFSSDRDLGGVEMVRVGVTLRGVSPQMTAEGVPGLIGDLAALAEERIEFEAEDFNHNVLVQGNEAQARAYWTALRQDAFVQLVATLPCDQVEIRDGRLVAELREIISDRRRLEQILDGLLNAVPILDASEADGGE